MLVSRLKELEEYKAICEKMILELIPQQSLPIKSEDLGKNPLVKEVEVMREEIERLREELKGKKLRLAQTQDKKSVDKIEADKTALQEALRCQILINEEQRKRIEIFKEALEARVNDFEVKDFLAKSTEQGLDAAEQFAQLVLIQKDIEAKRCALSKLMQGSAGSPQVQSESTSQNSSQSFKELSRKVVVAVSVGVRAAENE